MNMQAESTIRTAIHDRICKKYSDVYSWFTKYTKQLDYPIYSSYDIRDSGQKIVNVDANIFPAGFNNICPTDKETSVDLFRKFIHLHYSKDIKNILLITEEHTKNPYYSENIATISRLLTEAGFQVRLSFPQNLAEPLELESLTGIRLQYGSGYLNSPWVKEFKPDLVISNNDFSMAMNEWAEQMTLPLNPPRELGWYQRKKSRYFKNYNQLAQEFSEIIGMDPFYMTVETEEFKDFDINEELSRNQLAEAVDAFLNRLQKKYDALKIDQKPFCFVKNNAGTYGLGVVRVSSGEEVRNWSYNARKKMKAAKGGREIENVIIQEGIPSIVKADEATAEPVIYMIGCELAGGFMRSHAEKSDTESLNSPGAVYKKLCVTDLYDDRARCPRENVYGWSAKLGLLAIGLEGREMGVKYKSFIHAPCGSI